MSKVKNTKNELRRQKDDLKRFKRFLPTLLLKKQQLQLEILKILHSIDDVEERLNTYIEKINSWVAVFAEEIGVDKIISTSSIKSSIGNIAGTDIPIFEGVDFNEEEYSFKETPLWLDYGIEAIKNMASLKAEVSILKEQIRIVKEELRITTQRVNLFEKIKIPEATENIRKIRIFLGDMSTAAVVTGKIAKKKIEEKERALV